MRLEGVRGEEVHVQAIKVAICLANAHTDGRTRSSTRPEAQEGRRRTYAGWSADLFTQTHLGY